MAGYLGVPLWAEPGKWGAAVFEDGVEEYAEPGGKLDVVAGVAEPGCAQRLRARPRGEEGRLDDCDCRRGGIGKLEGSCESSPGGGC